MERRIAVVGDELSSGGHVLPYGKSDFSFLDHQVALVGGEAYCESCKRVGSIAKAGGPYRIVDGSDEVALDQDIVLCGCPTPPRIIAKLAGDSWTDDIDYGYGGDSSTSAAAPLVAQSTLADNLPFPHDEQFTLRDAKGTPLANTLYTICLPSGELIHSVTDSHGRTERHQTDGARKVRLYVGHRESV